MNLISFINVFLLCQEFGSSVKLDFTGNVQKVTVNEFWSRVELPKNEIPTPSSRNIRSRLSTKKSDVSRYDSNVLQQFQNGLPIPIYANQTQVNKKRRGDKKKRKKKHKHKHRQREQKSNVSFVNNEIYRTEVVTHLNNETHSSSHINLIENNPKNKEEKKRKKKKQRKTKHKSTRDEKNRKDDTGKVKYKKKGKKKRKQDPGIYSPHNKTSIFYDGTIHLGKTPIKNLNNEGNTIDIHPQLQYSMITDRGMVNLITTVKNESDSKTEHILMNNKNVVENMYNTTEATNIIDTTTIPFTDKNELTNLNISFQAVFPYERQTNSSSVNLSSNVNSNSSATNSVNRDMFLYLTDTFTTKPFIVPHNSLTDAQKNSLKEETKITVAIDLHNTKTEFNHTDFASVNDNMDETTINYHKQSYASAIEILHEINQLQRENEKEITAEDNVSKMNYGTGDLSCFLDTFVPAPFVENSLVKYKRIQLNPDYKLHSIIQAEYYCLYGFHMQSNTTVSLVCNSGRWLGEVPRCVRNGSDTEDVINDTSSCSIQDNVCEQVCRKVNGTIVCSCYHGFYLQGLNCTDVDECKQDNGGCEYSCLNIIGSYLCLCPEGYRLAVDQKTCLDINECLLRNGHGPCQDTCTNYHGSYSCSCTGLPGTRLASDNHTCEDVDECATGTSGCSHTCLNTLGRVFCLCPPGYELGNDWKTCYDINECMETDLQTEHCEFGCVNTPGSFYCQGQNDDQCIDNTCDNCITKDCSNEDTVKLNNDQIVCPTGFIAGPLGTCEDIDECAESNGGCSHECHNILGSSVCLCPSHLTVGSDWKTCIEMKTENPRVLCPSGFSNNENDHCQDINECQHNNGGCKHICTNLEGSYRCSCFHGFALDVDSISCIEVATAAVCPPLDVPPNGYLHCKRHVIMTKSYGPFRRPRRRVVNHAGTVCILKCPYNGKLQGMYRKTCTKNGHWIGPEHGYCNSKLSATHESHMPRLFHHFQRWNIFRSRENYIHVSYDFRAPEMKCPDNITVTIPQGQETTFVAIPQPETSVNWFRNVISEPLWGKLLEADLPAGHWKIKFTARHPISHLSASCTLHIMVNE